MTTANPVAIDAPAGVPFIDIAREFEHPVAALWAAHADPELFTRWLGPRGYEMDLTEFAFATGGRYRFVHRNPEGAEFAFNGVFHLVREPELVIRTFEWEGAPGEVSLEFARFAELPGGRSRLTGHSVFPSVATRDAMVANGMERGVVDGFEQLDEVLAARAA